MKQPVYTIGNLSFGFSLDSIRKRYSVKEDFFNDTIKAHVKADKTKLKKVLEKVWTEAFPQ